MGIFCFTLSSVSILKRIKYLKFLRIFILISSSIFYILYLIPISTVFQGLTSNDIVAVFQTNGAEAFDYLADNLKIYVFIPLATILAIFICLCIKNVDKYCFVKNQKEAVLFLLASIVFIWFYQTNALTIPIYDAADKIERYYAFYNNLKNREYPKSIEKNTKEGIYVVVIGESQNRDFMSVYKPTEYDTTPFLSSIKSSKNWFFFDNAYSCHVYTIATLTYALTQKNNYNNLDLSESYSIAHMLHEFDTYWLSNQKAVGYYGEQIAEIGLQTKHSTFINKSFVKGDPYDEELLKYLPKESSLVKTTIIFIHLMGNHPNYRKRYPEKFEKYPNTYANSILYNDYIVEQIYNHFASMRNFSALIYFSDHGEDTECACHNPSKFTWEMTKIPFYIYLSDNYIKQHPQKISTLKKHLHTPFTNDLFFETFLGILDITDKRFYAPENDLSNSNYNHTKSDLTTFHGEKSLAEYTTIIP